MQQQPSESSHPSPRHSNPWAWVPSLYFAEGVPYAIVMTVSLVLYKQLGMSNGDITYYTSWLYLPWVIKPLWSPFVDLVRTKRLWIIAMQLLIGASLAGVAFTIPTSFWIQGTLFFFWVMAFASATHDISADGFYMLGLDESHQSWFVGIRSTFYRLGMMFGQGLLVALAGNIQLIYRNSISLSWSLTFYGVAGLFIALYLYHGYILPRPSVDVSRSQRPADILRGLIDVVKTFFTRLPLRETLIGIAFMLLYRAPEALLSKIAPLFFLDLRHKGGMGLSPQELGFVQGTVGVIGLVLGGILGGILVERHGMRRWLWPMVCAITLPDIVYVYLSFYPDVSLSIVNLCVFVEQFGYGFGFTAYMLYLIYFSRGQYKTPHYSLCTAFMALSMMLPGQIAGDLQEMMGYRHFFVMVMLLCTVTFVVSALLRIDPMFGKKHPDEAGH